MTTKKDQGGVEKQRLWINPNQFGNYHCIYAYLAKGSDAYEQWMPVKEHEAALARQAEVIGAVKNQLHYLHAAVAEAIFDQDAAQGMHDIILELVRVKLNNAVESLAKLECSALGGGE